MPGEAAISKPYLPGMMNAGLTRTISTFMSWPHAPWMVSTTHVMWMAKQMVWSQRSQTSRRASM